MRYHYVTEDRYGAMRTPFAEYADARRYASSLSRAFPDSRFVVIFDGPVEYHKNGIVTNLPRWQADVDKQMDAIESELSK